MFLSTKSNYGLQALAFLARQGDAPVMNREIARTLAIPPHFLAKILQELSKNCLLASVKGKRTGSGGRWSATGGRSAPFS